uniref:Uncharacterized protein n=1 Tax=Nelumbo nucifera TaxID=4432 RepID=A0A822XYJ8_NELNU|nr:TPA_asm: hypothetical protein HUJ06_025298 [Nelumbo nucifera]
MDDLHSFVSGLRQLGFERNIEIGVNASQIPF